MLPWLQPLANNLPANNTDIVAAAAANQHHELQRLLNIQSSMHCRQFNCGRDAAVISATNATERSANNSTDCLFSQLATISLCHTH